MRPTLGLAKAGILTLACWLVAACGSEQDSPEHLGTVRQQVTTGTPSCTEELLTPVGAAASSQENASLSASKAIDGNPSTRWSSQFSDPQWLTIDLGAKRHISRVKLHWETAASKNYDIQVGDSASGPWSVAYTDSQGNGGVDDIAGLGVQGRYVRVYSRSRTTQYGNSLWEVQIYGSQNLNCCAIQPLTLVSAAASSQEAPSLGAGNAIDGDGATRWSSQFSDPQWLTIDLGGPRHLQRAVLDWETAASADYDIQLSDNSAGPWTTLRTDANGNGGKDVIDNLAATGRFVRVYSRARTTQWGVSLWEIKLHGDTNAACGPAASPPPPAPEAPALGGCDTAECCPPGSVVVTLTNGSDTYSNYEPNRCIVALDGHDTIFYSAPQNTGSVLGGPGDDVISAGPGAKVLRGGPGNDTINGLFGAELILGNAGDDTIFSGNADTYVVPGSGADRVTTGTGNDTVAIYDLCEVAAQEELDGGDGFDTLITPVPLAQLQQLGVTVLNFENIVVQQNSCKSDCVTKPDCSGNGSCAEGASPGQVVCQCDPGFSGPNCAGPAGPGSICTQDGDCAGGLVCGNNNGAYFGLPRATRVCWGGGCPVGCSDEPGSLCGTNCAGVNPCDQCGPDETCVEDMGRAVGAPFADACLPGGCPSDDRELCGDVSSRCGPFCICVPNCSSATCQNPSDRCRGRCPGVCGPKEGGCSLDVDCPAGHACVHRPDGSTQCLPSELCLFRTLAPPLCGSPEAPCGEECPSCTPLCDGRECGPDPRCGADCGSCGAGALCSSAGQCFAPNVEPPILVPDGAGGERPLEDLPASATSAVGAVPGAFQVTEAGTAQYAIPIAVPPGRAGIEPALSLVYSGARANGDLGVGWRLEGLSSITRCPRSYALDGYSANVSNTSQDRFCLDGKRLEALGSATYGADGTEYRTLIDSFAKIVSYQDAGDGLQLDFWNFVVRLPRFMQGPDFFRVWTKDGRILTYGRTMDSLTVARNGVRHAWLLNRVEDRSGNTMTIQYLKTEGNVPGYAVERYPSTTQPLKITYTGHGATPGNREVHFDYQPRADPQLTFLQGGVPSVIEQRLWRIRTMVNQVPTKNYRIEYPETDVGEPGGTLSLIRSVTECPRDGDVNCKKPTRFEYVEESGFDESGLASSLERPGMQLDANGDGIYDFAHSTVTVDDVVVSNTEKALLLVGDVTTTALAVAPPTAAVGVPAQIIWTFGKMIYGAFAHEPNVHIENDLSLSTGDRSNLFNLVENFGGFPCSRPITPGYLMDYDHDGDHDFLGQCLSSPYPDMTVPQDCPNPSPESETCLYFVSPAQLLRGTLWRLQLSRSDGNGHFTLDPGVALEFVTYGRMTSQSGGVFFGQRPFAYDINGDGLQDILACYDLDRLVLYRRLPPPAGFETTPSIFPAPDGICFEPTPTHMIFDVDGDGTSNLLIRGRTEWTVLRYTEVEGQPSLSWQTNVFSDVGFSGAGQVTTLGDFNGDGFVDITSDWVNTIWLNTGTGRFEPRLLAPRSSPANYLFGLEHRRSTIAVDFKGHGRSDLLELWARSSENEFDFWTVIYQKQIADSLLTQFSPKITNLGIPNAVQQSRAGLWQAASDVDGDGSIDLVFKHGSIGFGKGRRNNLLSSVEDGLGNFVTVEYDQGVYQAEEACRNGLQWPERCMPRLHGLVSRHTEGFRSSDQGQAPVHERSYEYRYFNARMSVTGHGWLGFDRVETKAFAGDTLRATTTTQLEPPLRYGLAGQGEGTTEPPYAYPLAGLPAKITVDFPELQSDIMSSAFARRTVTENDWQIGTSASGRPFPMLRERVARMFERDPSLPVDDNGTQLTNEMDSFFFDGYGNATDRNHLKNAFIQGGQEHLYSVSHFEHDTATWLISNPDRILISGSRGGELKQQRFELEYYPNGTLRSVSRAPGPIEPIDHTTTFTRNSFGNPVEIAEAVTTGQAQRATVIGYDSDNTFPSTIINALSQVTQLRYDQRWGVPKQIVDANNIISVSSYDDFGRLVETQTPEGSELVSYSAITAPLNQTAAGPINEKVEVVVERRGTEMAPAGFVTRHFDNYGRLVRVLSAGIGGDVVEEYAYDNAGRVVGATLPHLAASSMVPTVTYTYDPLDRLVRATHSDGAFTEQHYATPISLDAIHGQWLTNLCPTDGLTSSISICQDVMLSLDEEGHGNAVITDYRGLVLRSIDGNYVNAPLPQWSSYKYGAFSRLVEATDNGGNVTSFNYDAYGRLVSTTDPDSGTSTNEYTGFDELWKTTDPKAQQRTFEYDTLGRLRQVTDGFTVTSSFTYDAGPNAIGRLSEARTFGASNQLVTYTYEAPTAQANRGLLERVEYLMDGVEHSVQYTYDDAARLKQTRYPQGFGGDPVVTENIYDGSGILTAVDRIQGAARDPLWRLDQAFEGHLVQRETFGNGAVSTYAYNPQRRLLENVNTTLVGDEVQQIGYTHYANGLVRERTERNSNPRLYTYDSLNRLFSTVDFLPGGTTDVAFFSYSLTGNLVRNPQSGLGTVEINYQLNAPSRPHLIDNIVTPNGVNHYLYDDNGNVSERTGPDIPGGQQTIEYTPFDLPSAITSGTTTTSFEYSPFEERTIQRSPTSTRYSVADLYQRVAGTSTEDTIEQRFALFAGSRLLGEIVRTPGAEETLYFHSDHLGSVHTLTSSLGNVLSQRFDPFGAPIDNSDPATRFGFTGHQHDDALGLIDMRGRVFDTLAGRFATPDPIMQAPYWSQGLNRYAYVFNNPINLVDPSGFAVGDAGFTVNGVAFNNGTYYEFSGTSLGGSSTGFSALGAAGSIATGVGNVAGTLSMGSQGGTFHVGHPAPSATPASNVAAKGTSAVQQAKGQAGPPEGGDFLAQRRPPRRGQGPLPPGGGSSVLRPLPPQRIPHHVTPPAPWVIDLIARSEGVGGAHLIAKHVGRTPAQLLQRLRDEPNLTYASTFRSLSEAGRAVETVLTEQAPQVANWIGSGARGQLLVRAPFTGGDVLVRGASRTVAGSEAVVILRGNSAGSWRIQTGYVNP